MQDILLFLQHHPALSAALVIALIALTLIEYIKSRQDTQLTPALAIQMINHQNATILDIRNSDVFLTGHIVGSISIPLPELESKYKKLDKFKSQPIIIVCGTGVESTQAMSLLTKQGFNAQVLKGGIRGWKEADMPLVKE